MIENMKLIGLHLNENYPNIQIFYKEVTICEYFIANITTDKQRKLTKSHIRKNQEAHEKNRQSSEKLENCGFFELLMPALMSIQNRLREVGHRLFAAL